MSKELNDNLNALFGKLESYVSSKTVVGDAIHIGNVIIVPLVDISFALGAGAADGTKEANKKETNGGALGAKITPSAVLVIVDGNVQLVNIKNQDSLNKLIDMAPGVLSKINNFFSKKDDGDEKNTDSKADLDKKIILEDDTDIH